MNTIGHEERKAVFGSEMFSHQVVSFCSQARTVKEVRDAFFDVPGEKVRNTLSRQRKLGFLIKTEDGKYKATGKVFRGAASDLIWKGARTLQQFTVNELVRYTGLTIEAVYDNLRIWLRNGWVVVVIDGCPKTYKMVSKSISRPVWNTRKDYKNGR